MKVRKDDNQMALREPDTIVRSFGMKPQIWVIVMLLLITAGCAVSEKTPSSNHVALASEKSAGLPADDDFDLMGEEVAEQTVEVEDPLEPLNRIMYHVNDTLYFWVFKPVTEVYKNITPEPAQIGIRNFFHNLTTSIRFVNCHLQGKTATADMELNRFLTNTTVGILGFGDPAKDQHGLEHPEKEDMGQTLATYGLGDGFYIVWPLLGPSNVRDSVGTMGDLFLNPVFYIESTEATISISTVKFTNEKSFHIGEYETFKSAALDPYVAMREVYIQYRNKQIKE
jgi:phospholipid-binding lipoprotein MlaA